MTRLLAIVCLILCGCSAPKVVKLAASSNTSPLATEGGAVSKVSASMPPALPAFQRRPFNLTVAWAGQPGYSYYVAWWTTNGTATNWTVTANSIITLTNLPLHQRIFVEVEGLSGGTNGVWSWPATCSFTAFGPWHYLLGGYGVVSNAPTATGPWAIYSTNGLSFSWTSTNPPSGPSQFFAGNVTHTNWLEVYP
jgi:hypothetical protein